MSWADSSLLRPRVKANWPGTKYERQPGAEGPPSSTATESSHGAIDTESTEHTESLGSEDTDDESARWLQLVHFLCFSLASQHSSADYGSF